VICSDSVRITWPSVPASRSFPAKDHEIILWVTSALSNGIYIVDKMEASKDGGTADNTEQAFKHCGRAGRRGACISADITNDKLQDLIQQSEKLALEGKLQSSQEIDDNKAT